MFRLYSGLTQAQVSEAIGVDVSTYRAFETESAQPSREIIEKLAALYNAEPERLLNGFSGNEKYILFQEPPYNVYLMKVKDMMLEDAHHYKEKQAAYAAEEA